MCVRVTMEMEMEMDMVVWCFGGDMVDSSLAVE